MEIESPIFVGLREFARRCGCSPETVRSRLEARGVAADAYVVAAAGGRAGLFREGRVDALAKEIGLKVVLRPVDGTTEGE